MKNIKIKDKNGRVILESKGSRFVLSRFVDMDIDTKKSISELYSDLTGEEVKTAMEFLNFECEEKIQKFCS